MENWRKYLAESCDALELASTSSLGNMFPQKKIINDSYKMVAAYAPEFIKKSRHKDDVTYVYADTDDYKSGKHLGHIHGQVFEALTDMTVDLMGIAFRGQIPKPVKDYMLSYSKSQASLFAPPEMPLGARTLDHSDEKTLMINMGSFYRIWRKGDCKKESLLKATISLAGTIVHEIAHVEDKSWYKIEKKMQSKIKQKIERAIDDGLFDREAYESRNADTNEEVLERMAIFLEALKKEFTIFSAHMMASTEIYAYNTEISFYRNLLSLYKNGHKMNNWIKKDLIPDTELMKNKVAREKVAKYLPSEPDEPDLELTFEM